MHVFVAGVTSIAEITAHKPLNPQRDGLRLEKELIYDPRAGQSCNLDVRTHCYQTVI